MIIEVQINFDSLMQSTDIRLPTDLLLNACAHIIVFNVIIIYTITQIIFFFLVSYFTFFYWSLIIYYIHESIVKQTCNLKRSVQGF